MLKFVTLEDALKVIDAIKWPTAVLIFLLVAFFTLRQSIADLVRGFKNRSVNFKDTQIAAEQQAQASPVSGDEGNRGVVSRGGSISPSTAFLFEADDSQYVRDITNAVGHAIQARTFVSNEEREKWLWREGAKLEIRIEFEKIYRTMFQSQLWLLHEANNFQHLGGVEMQSAQQLYSDSAQKHPEFYKGYSLENWLKYLVINSLIALNGPRCGITEKGKLYLHYLLHEGHGTRANSIL